MTPPVDPREVRWTAGRLEELAAMQSEPMHAQLLRDAAGLIRRLEAQASHSRHQLPREGI